VADADDPRDPEVQAYEAETDRLQALLEVVSQYTPWVGSQGKAVRAGECDRDQWEPHAPRPVREARDAALVACWRAIGTIAGRDLPGARGEEHGPDHRS
jgi:hypothetical protein